MRMLNCVVFIICKVKWKKKQSTKTHKQYNARKSATPEKVQGVHEQATFNIKSKLRAGNEWQETSFAPRSDTGKLRSRRILDTFSLPHSTGSFFPITFQ